MKDFIFIVVASLLLTIVTQHNIQYISQWFFVPRAVWLLTKWTSVYLFWQNVENWQKSTLWENLPTFAWKWPNISQKRFFKHFEKFGRFAFAWNYLKWKLIEIVLKFLEQTPLLKNESDMKILVFELVQIAPSQSNCRTLWSLMSQGKWKSRFMF